MNDIGVVECGRPVRRSTGGGPCVLEDGHKSPFCQDARAIAAREKLGDVQAVAKTMRDTLNLLGLNIGVATSEDFAFRYIWRTR